MRSFSLEGTYPMVPAPADLMRFITAAKEKDASDESIVEMLETAGWPRAEVWRSLTSYYESLTGVAAPVGRKSTTPAKDAFFYLLAFSTLATWTLALGSICFILIDDWIPDPLSGYSYGYHVLGQIPAELAALIVTFPIYLLVMRVIVSETRRAPEKLDSGVRKWLTYIALLIAAGVMIGDIITFLTYFLKGDLTARFVWKVGLTLAISGGVFWYYFGSLREAGKGRDHENQ
jgi:hypothetical protein